MAKSVAMEDLTGINPCPGYVHRMSSHSETGLFGMTLNEDCLYLL